MAINFYHVDAFTDILFKGNPASVCLLDRWLTDALLQAIAMENNLTETAFIVLRQQGEYEIRWFTPIHEVNLCGHATLAAGYICLIHKHPDWDQVIFHSKSGPLAVIKHSQGLQIDLPMMPVQACSPPPFLQEGLGVKPIANYQGYNYLAILETEQQVATLVPKLDLLSQLPWRGLIVTAASDDPSVDFVSRFFVPKLPKEDPVTGSAHCSLAPYWSQRLGKSRLQAQQLSARGGYLSCEVQGDRVLLQGQAILYAQGCLAM